MDGLIPLIFDNENVIVESSWENIAESIAQLPGFPAESAEACKYRFHCSSHPLNHSSARSSSSYLSRSSPLTYPTYPPDSLLSHYSKGLISPKDFYSAVLSQSYGVAPSSGRIAAMRSIMQTMTGRASQEVIHLLKTAKLLGYPLYMISNSNPDVEQGNRQRHDYFSLFDRVIMSHDVHMRKPDLRIFRTVPRGIFIDDKLENTDAAQKAGHRSIRYKIDDPAGVLYGRLIDYGVAL